ncbi:FecR family protein [Chitinophaga flava]|uniref:FecR protein domain-containing protein n=1 Tax=Chitinophaga flava TaxID=2259036 RepID=A0A365Y3R0_9BACT|nr:FecR domain-containing protein [Chitinophaga flava]RBL92941.1 hypothetical protein DF182_10300 [Chitinophaga flava]
MTKPTDRHSFILLCLQSPQDAALQSRLQSWLDADEEHRELYRQLKLLWEQAPYAALFEDADAIAATARFLALLDQTPAVTPVLPLRRPRRRLMTAAAAVLFIAAGAAWWQYTRNSIQWLGKTTSSQPDSLLLADGSKIYLNKYSQVRYPAAFKGKERQVELTAGEAFFDIATDPVYPFTVTSGPAQIHVLGTSFNVKAGAEKIQVYVLSGRIALAMEHRPQRLHLQAGQSASCNTTTGELQAVAADINQLAWRTHELQFVDTSLQDVCNALSACYGVSMVLDPKISRKRKLNANFSNKTLEEVLQTLTALYDYQFQQLNDTIYVHLPVK